MSTIFDKLITRGTISFEKVQPIDVFGEGFAYLKNGYISTGIEVNWPGLFSLTETEIQAKVIGPIQQQCLNLPPGTVVTFQNFYKKKFVELGSNGSDDYLVQSQVKMYEEKWQKKYHKSYLFISYPSHYTVNDWVIYDEESFKRADRKGGKKLGKVVLKEKIENTVNIAKILNDTGILKCKVMNEFALRTYARDYTFVSHFDQPVPGTIRDSESHLSIGNKRLVTIGVAGNKDSVVEDLTYPEYTTDFTKPSTSGKKTEMPASFVHALGLGLDIDHILTLSFVVHDDVNLKKKVFHHMKNLEGIGKKFDNNLNKSIFTKGFIEGVQQDNADRLVSYYMNVQVFDKDADRLNEKVKLAVQAFEAVGLPAVIENYLNLDIFLGGLCGNGYTFPRQFLSSLQRVVRLFPYESHGYFSDKGVLVTSLSGNPSYLDFISKDTFLGNRKVKKTNFNITMFGKTGSGKSNMIGYMVMYLLQLKAHMILIDKGHSFGKLTKILSSLIRTKLYVYSEDNPLAFNPFQIEKKEGKYNTGSGEKIFLVNLLLGSIEKGFEENEIEQLKDLFTDFILVEYYDRVNNGEIKIVQFNSFYEFLREYITELEKKKDGVTDDELLIINNFPTDKVLIGLKKYYKGGSYSHLFNAEENYDVVDDQLIVFELDKIQSDPFLYRIVSMCISQIAEQKLKHEKLHNVLKFLGIDEGTFVLNSFLAEFFTGYYQTARKHGGGILFTDQTIDKLVETGKANRILGNSDTVIILEQKWTKQTLDYMRDYLEFTDEYIRKAKAIDNNGPWRQGVIKMNEVIENFQVNFSEEFFLALNTDADNKANQRLMKLLSTSANFKYAIKQTMADQDAKA